MIREGQNINNLGLFIAYWELRHYMEEIHPKDNKYYLQKKNIN